MDLTCLKKSAVYIWCSELYQYIQYRQINTLEQDNFPNNFPSFIKDPTEKGEKFD